MGSLKEKTEVAISQYQKIRQDLAEGIAMMQQLEAQLKENQVVQSEFELLKDDDAIYKLVGPTLLKQDQKEATGNVQKRIQFIQQEIKKSEEKIKALEKKQEAQEQELLVLQQQSERAQS